MFWRRAERVALDFEATGKIRASLSPSHLCGSGISVPRWRRRMNSRIKANEQRLEEQEARLRRLEARWAASAYPVLQLFDSIATSNEVGRDGQNKNLAHVCPPSRMASRRMR